MSTDTLTAITNAAAEALQSLTTRLYAGDINIVQWSLGVAGALKDAHVASGLLGAGSDTLGLGQLARVGVNYGDELVHLLGFATDIVQGNVSEAQALARIKQYGGAAQQEYWREKVAATEKQAAWAALPVLRQVPRDGGTQCRGNCNCAISEQEDGLHWELNPGESCEDCLGLAAGGPYRPG